MQECRMGEQSWRLTGVSARSAGPLRSSAERRLAGAKAGPGHPSTRWTWGACVGAIHVPASCGSRDQANCGGRLGMRGLPLRFTSTSIPPPRHFCVRFISSRISSFQLSDLTPSMSPFGTPLIVENPFRTCMQVVPPSPSAPLPPLG